MRHHYQTQPDLQLTPIEKIRLPLKSRDELPSILADLQWLWMHHDSLFAIHQAATRSFRAGSRPRTPGLSTSPRPAPLAAPPMPLVP